MESSEALSQRPGRRLLATHGVAKPLGSGRNDHGVFLGHFVERGGGHNDGRGRVRLHVHGSYRNPVARRTVIASDTATGQNASAAYAVTDWVVARRRPQV